MAEGIQLLYREHRIFAHDSGALVLRICFERLSDGHFAVVHTEFLRETDNLTLRLAEISVTTAILMLDPEQPGLWEFFPTVSLAIAKNDAAFADMNEWIKNAQN